MNSFNSKNKSFIIIAILFFIALNLAYSNHFDNDFHFDDSHTIVNNQYIRDISNLPKFFTDVKYYGTMPTNRGYNPILVSLNAIDYWIAGSLDVRYFHTSIYISYIVLLILLYFMIFNIFRITLGESPDSIKLFALLAVGFFGLHAANAETINYIIMRSDSFSTLCIILSLLLFQNKKLRKYNIYLLTMLVGIGTKATGVMFGPILFIYAYLFEQNGNFLNIYKKSELINLRKAFTQALPAILIGFVVFYLSRTQFVSENSVMFAGGDHAGIYKYFITQWVVITHYLGNFLLPLDLSGDPDFKLFGSILNRKVIFSLMLLLALFILGLISSSKKKYKPITFGIFWFFLALAPTSSFHPMGQVSNDHRTFFPYIGLIICLFWILYLLYLKFKTTLNSRPVLRHGIIVLSIIIYSLHAYGTYQRNEIWQSETSLWKDVTIKSPNNGRGLMNYGLTLMTKGQYKETKEYFDRAMEFLPYYSYLHINMGILRNVMGFPEEAEIYFNNALRYDRSNAEAYRFYARFLLEKNRNEEAYKLIDTGLSYSPGHSGLLSMKQSINIATTSNDEKLAIQIKAATENPSVNNYINLSLLYFNNRQYKECINACEEVLKLDPKNVLAFNNMCVSYTRLGDKEKAILACEKAIELKSDFQLAKNNLNLAKSMK